MAGVEFFGSNLKLEEQHLSDYWERCLSDDTITIPHRVIRTYNQQGDCTRVIQTNFLYRDNESDSESTPIQEEIENKENEDPAPTLVVEGK